MMAHNGWVRLKGLTRYSWLLIIVVIAASVIFVSYARPAKVVVDEVARPVAESVGIVSRTCPSGWNNTSARDEHLRVLSCEKAGWLVVLDAESKFQYGVKLDTLGAQFIYDKNMVPGWTEP